MGETVSRFGSQASESKCLLSRDPAVGSEASSYSSINGSKSVLPCAPCTGAATSSFVTCPTCQGTGEIPSELEKQLVALIPYGDQRLKPRRTKLYVSLAVFTCLLMTSLIIFFLFPRSILVQPAGLSSSEVAFTDHSILLNVTNVLNITNNYYYPITVTQLNIEVLHLLLVVGQMEESILLHIGPLSSEQIIYSVTSKIDDENTYNICTWLKIKVHNVLQHIRGTLTCSYLSHTEQLAFQSYDYVDCRGNTSLPHSLVPHPP
ncbi:transmembrane protein 106A [Sarcophilus harrisii]|uniref:transmembrane protein 106A n=1 Tax=Sarcophilus harrisii TaxID=9305 RepID=UPI000226FC68|nr:transmembrane protein 106A [Sarcophilus harrisii]XP_023358087.1 transmembrane protein 106A [Sarcophilus harrisii]